jgi:hypothetical protein
VLVEFHVKEFSAMNQGVLELKGGFGGVPDGGFLELKFKGIDLGLQMRGV